MVQISTGPSPAGITRACLNSIIANGPFGHHHECDDPACEHDHGKHT